MGALTKIRESGFDIALADGFIEISPSSKLTDQQRDYIKTHKPEIISELQAEAANDPSKIETDPVLSPGDTRRFCRQCQHSTWVCGRGEQVVRCDVNRQLVQDDWPRHCTDYIANGKPIPTEGVRWTPEAEREKPIAFPRHVTCFTPIGNPVLVMATDPGHEAYLTKMNPKPTETPPCLS